jgi:hypothetical protein
VVRGLAFCSIEFHWHAASGIGILQQHGRSLPLKKRGGGGEKKRRKKKSPGKGGAQWGVRPAFWFVGG